MNYSELCGYCREGNSKPILRMLKEDGVDILWKDGQLLHAASRYGGAEALNILIDYYIAHIRGDPKSDEYLSAMSKLIEALNVARQLSSFTREVTEIFNKYIPEDYEEGSDDESDFVEDDQAIAEACGAAGVDYSSEEYHRRESDSSDMVNMTVRPLGETLDTQ